MNRGLYIGNGIERSGPYTEDEVRAFIHSGHVTAESLCWKEGMSAWFPAGQMFPGLFPPAQQVSPVPSPTQPEFPSQATGTVQPQTPQPYTLPPSKKRSCCCSGCLVMILLIILLIGGIAGVAWYKYRQPASPVDKEYKTIPDYFPPAPDVRLGFPVPGGAA